MATERYDIKLVSDGLNQVLRASHHVIEVQNSTSSTSSGTTIVLALCVDQHYVAKNTGDSRCYLYSQNELRQISTDDSCSVQCLAGDRGTPRGELGRGVPV